MFYLIKMLSLSCIKLQIIHELHQNILYHEKYNINGNFGDRFVNPQNLTIKVHKIFQDPYL